MDVPLMSPTSRRPTISLEAIKDLRRRLSPDPKKPISQQRFGEILGVSWSTVARWETGRQPDPTIARKLVNLRRALDALGRMVKPEYRVAFFEHDHPLLANVPPIDLLGSDKGARAVLELLEGARTGSFT